MHACFLLQRPRSKRCYQHSTGPDQWLSLSDSVCVYVCAHMRVKQLSGLKRQISVRYPQVSLFLELEEYTHTTTLLTRYSNFSPSTLKLQQTPIMSWLFLFFIRIPVHLSISTEYTTIATL